MEQEVAFFYMAMGNRQRVDRQGAMWSPVTDVKYAQVPAIESPCAMLKSDSSVAISTAATRRRPPCHHNASRRHIRLLHRLIWKWERSGDRFFMQQHWHCLCRERMVTAQINIDLIVLKADD